MTCAARRHCEAETPGVQKKLQAIAGVIEECRGNGGMRLRFALRGQFAQVDIKQVGNFLGEAAPVQHEVHKKLLKA